MSTCVPDLREIATVAEFADRLRPVIDGRDAHHDSRAVTRLLRAAPPTLELVRDDLRASRADGPVSRIVHAEQRFSLVALVLGPGQQTSVHDHLTWCVVSVLCGTELETRYEVRGGHLTWLDESTNDTGSISALTPPGDIHRVRGAAGTTTISLHVYGADLRAPGSSVRRTYDLPTAAN